MVQGFPRTNRLRDSAEIRAVTRDGRRHQDTMFTIYARPNSLNHARLGVTVSRRISPRATHRNRIKRIIRESFRSNQEHIRGHDIVVVARGVADITPAEALRASLLSFWNSIGKPCGHCS